MWNLLAGYAGLMSVGQQAYIGIGAYGLWIFTDKVGLHPVLAVLGAGVLAAIISVPTAALLFRLRGGYFAIGTWVMAEAFRLIVANNDWLGGGSGVTITSVTHMKVSDRIHLTYWLALAVAVGVVLLVYFVLRSRLGLGLTAIRDNEVAAESLGVRVFRTKLWVYIIAAFGAGVTGAAIYMNLLRVQPDAAFGISWTAFTIFIVIIGGFGTIEGPILGAAIYFALQETLSQNGSAYLILLGRDRGGRHGVVPQRSVGLRPPQVGAAPVPRAAGSAPLGGADAQPAPPTPTPPARPTTWSRRRPATRDAGGRSTAGGG